MLIDHSRRILIYSQFGRGKTTLLAELAAATLLGRSLPTTPEELASFTQAVAECPYRMRLVTAEHTGSIKDIIATGLIEVWNINLHDYPFETLRFAAQGFWPADRFDPVSKLVPPTNETWERYPIRAFEGTKTLATYLSGDSVKGGLLDRIGNGEKIGGDPIYFRDGETGVGSHGLQHYKLIQNHITASIERSTKRPGIILWTAHEDEVKEKVGGTPTGRTVIGPEVFGGALTTTLGLHFDDVWHIAAVEAGEGGTIDRRLYVKEYTEGNIIIKAKNSAGKHHDAGVADYYRLTIDGKPRMDVGQVIVDKLGILPKSVITPLT